MSFLLLIQRSVLNPKAKVKHSDVQGACASQGEALPFSLLPQALFILIRVCLNLRRGPGNVQSSARQTAREGGTLRVGGRLGNRRSFPL